MNKDKQLNNLHFSSVSHRSFQMYYAVESNDDDDDDDNRRHRVFIKCTTLIQQSMIYR